MAVGSALWPGRFFLWSNDIEPPLNRTNLSLYLTLGPGLGPDASIFFQHRNPKKAEDYVGVSPRQHGV